MNRNPGTDVASGYRLVPEDFVKHLMTTLAIVVAVVLAAAAAFGVPEKPPLTIRGYAMAHPVAFEQLALRALDGQGRIANYGPPYNHGTGNVESPLQAAVGILHPVNAAQDFILKPLAMAAVVNPAMAGPLHRFEAAPTATRARWEAAYTQALTRARVVGGTVRTAPGRYGPVPALLNDVLALGRSGLMSGALTRNGAVVTRFDNQNYLLFLQGAPLHAAAKPLGLLGEQWGIIHPAVASYPGAWWMTVPTWIYQWPPVAASPAADALALGIGFLFWVAFALTPWIPGWNRLPRYLGVHRLVWRDYYRAQGTKRAAEREEGGGRYAS